MTKKVFFMGTPEFACASLRALARLDIELVGVACQQDKKRGRGQKFTPSPVKVLAEELSIPVFQPATLKKGTPDGDLFFEQFQSLKPDLCVVTAYGRIIPKRFLAYPTKGFVNVHGSKLPRWRGAAPIQRAIEAGDSETAITIMDMIYELDAGDIYQIFELNIEKDDNAITLTQKLADLSEVALTETIPTILQGQLPKIPQPAEGITYAEMLSKEEGRIDFCMPAETIYNKGRAFAFWPGLFTVRDGQPLKLHEPVLLMNRVETKNVAPGTIVHLQDVLGIMTGDGVIGFKFCQPAGKPKMTAMDFINGYRIQIGARLGH